MNDNQLVNNRGVIEDFHSKNGKVVQVPRTCRPNTVGNKVSFDRDSHIPINEWNVNQPSKGRNDGNSVPRDRVLSEVDQGSNFLKPRNPKLETSFLASNAFNSYLSFVLV